MIINSIIAGAGGGGGIPVQTYTITSDITLASDVSSLLNSLMGSGKSITAWLDGDATATGYSNQFVEGQRNKIGSNYGAGVRYRSGAYNVLQTTQMGNAYDWVLKAGQTIKYIVIDSL